MSAYTRRDLRVECKRPYAREMRRFVCAFRLRTYGVRSVNPALRCSFRVDVATALRRWRHYTLDGDTLDAELWQCRRPDQHVSKYFHGLFITINSMIIYFKHIIHIDDFPLNMPLSRIKPTCLHLGRRR